MSEAAAGERLQTLLGEAGQAALSEKETGQFEKYLSLFVRWNARINLSAIRDEEGILTRHFVESIACARALPEGIGNLLDFGSGGGLPGIPIAICRPEIAVTLGESQGKKAAFLLEVVRTLGLGTGVRAGRAEELDLQFDCVTLRAVDKMAEAVGLASGLVRPGGWLALMTTGTEVAKHTDAAGAEFEWGPTVTLPGSADRVLALGSRGKS